LGRQREWTFLLLYPSCHTVNLTTQYQLCGLSRLCYFLARDGFCPRQLSLLGDRLVYPNGIILPVSCCFSRYLPKAIILYAFTPSQVDGTHGSNSGHHWQASALMNGLGSHCYSSRSGSRDDEVPRESLSGNPLLVSICSHSSSQCMAERLSIQGLPPRSYVPRPKAEVVTHPAVVVIGQLNRGTLEALRMDCCYSRCILQTLQQQWRQL